MKVRAKYFRFNKRILILIGVASFASFIFLQQGFKVAPVAAYFSIFSRAWELGIGSFLGILAFHKKPDAFYSRSEQYLPLIFALLLAALTTTRSNWALLIPIPVLATGIFLYVGQGQAKAEVGKSRLLKCARRMLLYIGAISYSLYLVHWPIFIIASHLGFINGLVSKLTLIPVSIFFAHLLWKLIEIPFQSIILPKPFNFEEIAFNFFKRRRLAIYTLTFCIIGSLYVVTYPSVSGGLINSDSKMAAIANDPAILKYSDYQANIVNPADINSAQNLNLNPQDSGTVTNVSLSDLLATNTMMLQNGLEQSQLTQIGKQFFPQLSRDMNAFETSSCSKTDLEIPPDCSIRGTDIAAKKIAIIGDSKMAQFAQPIMDYFKVRGWAIYPYVSTGCRIYAPVNSDIFTNCTKRSAWVKNQIKNNSFDLVIGASYPEGFMVEHIASPYLDEIIKASKQTILLTQFTRVENPRACIKADYTYQPSCSQLHDVEMASYKQNKKFLMSKSSPKVHVIDTTVWTCIENKCPMVVGDIFLTRDGSHLSNSFIKKITPIINATLDSISAW